MTKKELLKKFMFAFKNDVFGKACECMSCAYFETCDKMLPGFIKPGKCRGPFYGENKQTKYFIKYFDTDSSSDNLYKLDEIQLNGDNWFYVQIDASIRFVFNKYGFSYPKYCIVEKEDHNVIFYIYRNINNEKDLIDWCNKGAYVIDELKRTADANSTDSDSNDDNWIKYEFKFI